MVSLSTRPSADTELTASIERLIGRFSEHHQNGDVSLIRRAGLAALMRMKVNYVALASRTLRTQSRSPKSSLI